MSAQLTRATLAALALASTLSACSGSSSTDAGSPGFTLASGSASIGNGGVSTANSAVVGTPSSTTYSLTNTGPSALSITGVTIGGLDAASFSVTTQPASMVAAGSTTTFVLAFNPTTPGSKSATVTVASDAQSFTFSVHAVATAAPVAGIAVSANSAAVTSGGAAIDFGPVLANASSDVNITITNTGTAALAITSATVTAGAADFSIAAAPSTSVPAGGGTTTFTVKFAPSASGARTGAITLANSSANQPSFAIDLSGTAVPVAASISVSAAGGATGLVEGGSLQLSAVVSPAGAGQAVTWSTGAANVATVSATGLVTAVGAGTATITATANDGSNVAGSLVLTVASGLASHISISGTAGAVTSGGAAIDLGSALTGATATAGFTVTNSGNTALTLTSANVTSGASDFSIATSPAASIAAGASASFTVAFTPSATGVRTGSITLSNSSANQPAFVLNLTGTGVQSAASVTVTSAGNALSITGPGNTLQLSAAVAPAAAAQAVTWSSGNPGVATVSASGLVTAVSAGTAVITATAADGSGAKGSLSITVLPTPASNIAISVNGSAVVAGGAAIGFGSLLTGTSASQTFTIVNSGTAALSISSASVTAGASDFSITSAPGASIAAGGSTTFTVQFAPSAAGLRAGALTLANSSANTPSFVINLGGTAVQAVTGIVVTGAAGAATIVGPGNTLQLSAAVTPASAAQGVTWSSGTPGVATVSASGLVTAVSAGTAVITAAATDASGISGTLTITVLPAPTSSIAVSEGGSAVASGGSVDFGAVFTGSTKSTAFTIANSGAAALTISSASVTSGASDFSILTAPAASVAASGSTTFLVAFSPSATGTRSGTITLANSSANQASFTIALTGTGAQAATSIAVTAAGNLVSLAPGGTVQLSAAVTPAGAAQGVTWSSGTPSIATVSATGLVTAVGTVSGSSVITATAADGSGVTGALTINVVAPGQAWFVKQTNGTSTATLTGGTLALSNAYSTSGNAFKYVAPNYYGTNANGFVSFTQALTGDFSMTANITITSTPKANSAAGVGFGITTGFTATDRWAYFLMPTSGSASAKYVSGAGVISAGSPSVPFTIGAVGTGTTLQVVFSRTGTNLTYGIAGNTNTAATSYFTDGTTVYGAGAVYPCISFNNAVATVTSFVIKDGSGNTLFDSSTGSLITFSPASLNLSATSVSVNKGSTATLTATALAGGGATATVSAVAADPTVVGVSVSNGASNSTITLTGLKAGNTNVTVTNNADTNAATNTQTFNVTVNDYSTSDAYGSIAGLVYPAPGAAAAYVDGELSITFDSAPTLNTGGTISIYNLADGSVADTIAYANETQTIAGVAVNVTNQLVRVSGNTVYFTPHFGKLAYGASYYVGIPTAAISATLKGSPFVGFSNAKSVATWSFTTKAAPGLTTNVTVDGSQASTANFRTVGGALMYLAANPIAGATLVNVSVAAGTYIELVNYRAATANPALTISISGPAGNARGNNAIIQWTNGGNLNAQPARASFYFAGANLVLQNLTLQNTGTKAAVAQAETLYFNSGLGYTVAANNCSFLSHQDTIQTSGRAWFYNSFIEGNTDFIWGTSDAALIEKSALHVVTDPGGGGSTVYSLFVARTGTTGAATVGKGYVLLNSTVSVDSGMVAAYGRDAGTGSFYDQVALIGNVFSGAGSLTTGLWVTTTPPLSLGDSTYVGWKASGNSGLGADTMATAAGTAATIASQATEYDNRSDILNRVVTVSGGMPTGFTAASFVWDTSSLAAAFGAQ